MKFLEWVTTKWNVSDFEPIPDTVDAIEALEARLEKIHGEEISFQNYTCNSGLQNYIDQEGEICLTEVYCAEQQEQLLVGELERLDASRNYGLNAMHHAKEIFIAGDSGATVQGTFEKFMEALHKLADNAGYHATWEALQDFPEFTEDE
jgi:hypothetical protein